MTTKLCTWGCDVIVLTAFDKLDAIRIICPKAEVKKDTRGNWYVSTPYLEFSRNDGFLRGIGDHAPTPYAAVDNMWDEILDVMKAGGTAVACAYRLDRREYRWNGGAWEIAS